MQKKHIKDRLHILSVKNGREKLKKLYSTQPRGGEYSVDMVFDDEEKYAVEKVAEELKNLDYFIDAKMHVVHLPLCTYDYLYACDYSNHLSISWSHKRFVE